MEKVIKVRMDDDFECTCGNNSHMAGFFPSNLKGEEIEPTVENEWAGHYVCSNCNQIYLNV